MSTKRTCQECGRELDPSDEFCTNCGAKVPPAGAVTAPEIVTDSGSNGHISAEEFKKYEVTKGVRYDENGAYYRFDTGKVPENVKKATLKAQKGVLTSGTASVMRKTYVMSIVLLPIALIVAVALSGADLTFLPYLIAALLFAPSIAIAVGNSKVYKSAIDTAQNRVSTSGLEIINIAVWVRTILVAIAIVALLIANSVVSDEMCVILAIFGGMLLLLDISSIMCLKTLKYELETCTQVSHIAKVVTLILTIFVGSFPAISFAVFSLFMPLIGSEFDPFMFVSLALAVYGIYSVCAGKLLVNYHKEVFGAIAGELRKEQKSEETTEPVSGNQANVPVCPKCGAQVAADSQFCMACGTKLEKPAEKADRPSFCPYCGSKLNADSAFCTSCGKKL